MKAPAVTTRSPISQALQGCLLILAVYLILKHVIVLEDPFSWLIRHLRSLPRLYSQETSTTQDNARQIISNPSFDMEDANPIDRTRLICFVLICCAFVIPFLC